MSYNGSGTFNINTAGQPVVTGTVISSTTFNALTADLGTGLSTALTKDGQTVATARIPFAQGINSSLVTDATSTTTGSIITAGGVGIAKALYVGTTLNVTGASTLAGITGAFNGTVGATTPSTGAFTTLSASGATTLTSASANQLVLTGGTTVETRLKMIRGSDDSGQFLMAGWGGLVMERTGQAVSAVQPFTITMRGTTDVVPISVNYAGLSVTGTLSATGAITGTAGFGAFTASATTGQACFLATSTGGYLVAGTNNASGAGLLTGTAAYAGVIATLNSTNLVFGVNSAIVGTFDSSGNLGIGTSSPQAKLQVAGASNATVLKISATDQASGTLSLGDGSSTTNNVGIFRGQAAALSNGNFLNLCGYEGIAFTVSNNALGSQTERARIDSSGNLLVAENTATGTPMKGAQILINSGETVLVIGHITGTLGGVGYASFILNGSQIGSITQNGTTGVLYNLTSDYRLKNNQQPLTGAKDFIMALKPKKWQWWDGSGEGVGFVAHEFMEVAKYSGHGEKDAVEMQTYEISPAVPATQDEEGNELTAAIEAVMGEREVPKYQSIQPSSSEVMANLVAHIQELESRLAALEAK